MFNSKVVLAKRPDEKFPENLDCFSYVTNLPIPGLHSLSSNELLLKMIYISIEPVTRVWISGVRSYLSPTNISQSIPSFGIAQVLFSKDKKYKSQDLVFGILAWEDYHITNSSNVIKLPLDITSANIPKMLSLFGPTGLTAFLGLKEVGNPKPNDILVVSAAAGSCGSIVVQLGKRFGCKVIGIAGSEEKCDFVRSLGADECINYKKADKNNTLGKMLRQVIKKMKGNGIDIFFDNVGEESLDAGLENLNQKARIILCGAMATYGNWKNYVGLRNISNVISKRAIIQGILYFGQVEKCKAAILELWNLNQEKEIISIEEIVVGIENAPKALQKVYNGENKGKFIIALNKISYNGAKL